MLVELFKEEILKEEEHTRGGIYPSELTTCKRSLWYETHDQQITNPIEASSKAIMAVGCMIEDVVIKALQAGILVKNIDRQVVVKVPIEGCIKELSGKMDAVVEYTNGEKEGIEVKSGFGYSTTQVMKNNIKEEWLYQICSYLNFGKCDKIRLFYFDRGHGYTAEFHFFYFDNILKAYRCVENEGVIEIDVANVTKQDIINRCLELDKVMLSESEIPERVGILEKKVDKKGTVKLKPSYWRCGGYCPYETKCREDWLPVEAVETKQEITEENF